MGIFRKLLRADGASPVLQFPDFTVDIERKRVKTLRIVVYPGDGRVRVSAPARSTDAAVRAFVELKADWIRKHLTKGATKPKAEPLSYVSGETHRFFGKEYPLSVEPGTKPRAFLRGDTLVLQVSEGSAKDFKEAVMAEFFRDELKKILPAMMDRREAQMDVKAVEWRVRRMKTKWGTCNVRDKRVWFSTELAKKPPEFVEYVVTHELAHLIERGHGPRFKALLDRFYPGWREVERG